MDLGHADSKHVEQRTDLHDCTLCSGVFHNLLDKLVLLRKHMSASITAGVFSH